MKNGCSSDEHLTELIGLARRGSREACDALLERHRSYLHLLADRALRPIFRSRVDDSDLVQQTCLEAYEGLPRFQGEGPAEFMAWLEQILSRNAANFARDHTARKRDVHREIDLPDHGSPDGSLMWHELSANGSGPVTHVLRGEAVLHLADCMSRLTLSQRTAIEMRYLEGFKIADIAEYLDKTPAAAAQIIYRGLVKLRQMLPQDLVQL